MKLKNKKIIYLFLGVVIVFSLVLFISLRYKKSARNCSYFNCSSSVYIHDKYTKTENDHLYYYITISYSIFGKTYHHTLKINDDIVDKQLFYDSLFTNMEYDTVHFVIDIPIAIAEEANILAYSLAGKPTAVDLELFFAKEDTFIEQWLEIYRFQAEAY